MNPRLSIYVLIFMAIYARNHNAPFEEMAFAAMAILECFLAWIEDKHAELAAEIAALSKETP